MDNDAKKDFDNILSNGEKLSNLSDGEKKDPYKVSGIWSALFLLCMLVVVGGVSYYFIYILNSKSIMVSGIAKMSSNMKRMVEPLNVNYDFGDKFSSTNSMKFSLEGKDIEDVKSLVNNSELSYNIMYDKPNKKMFIDMDSKIDDVKFDLDYYINDKENYLFLYDIYDKYIKMDDLTVSLFKNKLTKDDIEYVYKTFLTSFNKNLDESFITRKFSFSSNPTVTSTLDMSEGNFVTLLNVVKKEVMNDSRINEILLMYMTQGEIDGIKEKELDIKEFNFENFKLITTQSIITDNLNRVELIVDSIGESTRYVYEKNDDNIDIRFFSNDKEQLKVNIKFNGDNFDLNMYEPDRQQSVLTLTGRKDNDYYVYTMKVVSYNRMIYRAINGEGNNSYEEEDYCEMTLRTKFVKSSNLSYDISFGYKYSDYSFTLSNNGSISPLTSDINKDTSNYESYEDVDEEVLAKNLEEKLKPLREKIQSLLGIDTEDYVSDF